MVNKNYTIIRSNRKTFSLQVLCTASVVVKAPTGASLSAIDTFIKDNTEWIQKQKEKILTLSSMKKEYSDGEKITYLGKIYTLKIGRYEAISFKDGICYFPQAAIFRAEKELNNWYIKEAQRVIPQQVALYAKEMKVQYESISFSDTRSKWASCTSDNRLQFSWRLIMAPLLVINYVVVHELTHIQEKNHSRSFWNKVRLYNPSFKQQLKWLKTNGALLHL